MKNIELLSAALDAVYEALKAPTYTLVDRREKMQRVIKLARPPFIILAYYCDRCGECLYNCERIAIKDQVFCVSCAEKLKDSYSTEERSTK